MLNNNKLQNKKVSTNDDIITQRESEGNKNRPSLIKVNCGAEFIKCYLTCGKKKRNHLIDDDENDGNLLSGNCCKNINCCQRLVCVLLFIIGLCCQPVYLAVYVMMLLIHCMKTIGCGMFLYIMNNH